MFELHSKFEPCGDQPQAIEKLVEGVRDGLRTQVLLGVTGSGKTFTMANVIKQLNRPALVIAHNKTLAAQLCNEFREFFPNNRVEYFVSYYDYYQPEAYIPRTDTYIEKDLSINDEIDKLRHSATGALCESRDVIVVASVSCIYGLGAPLEYFSMAVSLRPGMTIDREELIDRLIEIQYKRSDIEFDRASFRVRGDVVEVFPVDSSEVAVRVEFWGDEIEKIVQFDPLTAKPISELKHVNFYPASHYVVEKEKKERALEKIGRDMVECVKKFEEDGKLLEAQRLKERVSYDIEMIREMGYCSGIENYSRYFDGRSPGQPPYTLLDFFPKDFILFVDESHMTLPQLRAMYNGDLSRKVNLVDYGFRLPSAYDNRPLRFEEFDARVGQMICVSATPGPYELKEAGQVVEQLIRPTGLLDPEVTVRPVEGQIDDLLSEIHVQTEKGGRVLVTTLTKKMAESLTEYLKEQHVRVKYMHSDVDTLDRIEIIAGLRRGDFDVLVGINLLREGLDLPEVTLVAILDADKEGFLRSETSLIQTIGRAARNSEAKVVMYADTITGSMRRALDETDRRREKQKRYNDEHGIIPRTIVKPVTNTLEITKKISEDGDGDKKSVKELYKELDRVQSAMKVAAASLDFELAIRYREQVAAIKKRIEESGRKKRG
ncbi:MAG TPA: excinuclease ABC subunit UvrB [Candidatus Ornithoclostridium excrementipullorum]|nr:excinuclease ABC subunit UvrB [Candidatus Ornithoclostridium excrementipullorum]